MKRTIIEKGKFIFENNAFDLIRYFAAFCVMFGHFVWKYKEYVQDSSPVVNAMGSITTFFPGVVILFSISGFLVSASYERSENPKEFFRKRVLRMYPELWVCTMVNLLVVCVLASELLDKSIIIWLFTQVFGIANTPSCLVTFATGSINGALWTIFTEVQLYIILGFFYSKLKKLDNKKWMALLLVLAVCNVTFDFLSDNMGGVAAKIIERFFLTYALWFFIGVFCYVNREKLIPKLKVTVPLLLLMYIIAKVIPVDIPGYYSNIAIGVLLPLIVIGGVLLTTDSYPLRFKLRNISLSLDCS